MSRALALLAFAAALVAGDAAPPVEITIDQALTLLERNNPAFRAASAGIDAARAARDLASRRSNPDLTVGVDSLTARDPRRANDNGPEFGVELEQRLETADKRRWRTANAAALERAALADAAETTRRQRLGLHQTFWGAVLAREQQRVAGEDLASVRQSEALMKEQVAAGAIAEGDLLRFQVSAAQFQQAELASELAYQQAVRDLAGTLAGPGLAGMPPIAPETPLAPVGELAAPLPELSREDVRRRAQQRPDVISAQRQVEAAEAALRLADAQRVPDVTLGVSGGREGSDTLVGVSASIELPVFNSYTGAVVQAEAQRRQAAALRQQALAAALADADKTWLAYDSARRTLAIYDGGTIEQARAALAATEAAYKEGAIDLIAVLDARRTYDQVRMAWLQALYDARVGVAQVELLGSGGGGGGAKVAAPSAGGGDSGGGDD